MDDKKFINNASILTGIKQDELKHRIDIGIKIYPHLLKFMKSFDDNTKNNTKEENLAMLGSVIYVLLDSQIKSIKLYILKDLYNDILNDDSEKFKSDVYNL